MIILCNPKRTGVSERSVDKKPGSTDSLFDGMVDFEMPPLDLFQSSFKFPRNEESVRDWRVKRPYSTDSLINGIVAVKFSLMDLV